MKRKNVQKKNCIRLVKKRREMWKTNRYGIHEIAEEIAEKEFDCGFYDLSEKQQDDVWTRAEVEYIERLQDNADTLRKELELHDEGGVLWSSRKPKSKQRGDNCGS